MLNDFIIDSYKETKIVIIRPKGIGDSPDLEPIEIKRGIDYGCPLIAI
jgi:hypothetical protein